MSWGTKTVLTIAIFVTGIMTMVFISMNQKIDLVTDNYYEKDLLYQNEIDKINNTLELEKKPEIRKTGNIATIIFPENVIPDSGKILLYKPADEKQDKVIRFSELKNNSLDISFAEMTKGFWRIKINWAVKNKEYKTEESFYN